MRAASTRRRVQSTRRVTARTVDARNRRGSGSRWRPYAPSAAVPPDVWGTDLGNDDRPLVSDLTAEELAAEALSALRNDRPVPQDEPWLLDIGAASADEERQPPAKRRQRSPRAVPGDAPARPSPPRHAPPRHAAAKRARGRRVGWVVVTGAAVLVVGGWGWQMVASADDGSGTGPMVPVTSTGQVVPATAQVGPLGPPASAVETADPAPSAEQQAPAAPSADVPTPTVAMPPGTTPAGESAETSDVTSGEDSSGNGSTESGSTTEGGSDAELSTSDEDSSTDGSPARTAVLGPPPSSGASTTSNTPDAPAVVSPLESGDPGFGWPTTAFGTPTP